MKPCGIYEEAREHGDVGYGENGEEFSEEANGFTCDVYEECCNEGCTYNEVGQEECF